jgi:hypothetical protein
LNFIFGIVCLFVCVCAFSLRRESPDMILGDKPLIFEVVLSHQPLSPPIPQCAYRASRRPLAFAVGTSTARPGSAARGSPLVVARAAYPRNPF